jgi:hypothetical protein
MVRRPNTANGNPEESFAADAVHAVGSWGELHTHVAYVLLGLICAEIRSFVDFLFVYLSIFLFLDAGSGERNLNSAHSRTLAVVEHVRPRKLTTFEHLWTEVTSHIPTAGVAERRARGEAAAARGRQSWLPFNGQIACSCRR